MSEGMVNLVGCAHIEITQEQITRFQELWRSAGNGKLSFTKAKKRLEKAVASGCEMCDDCTKCSKVRECPIVRVDEDGANGEGGEE